MTKIYPDESDDFIDICFDNVFKAVFTGNTPESQSALASQVLINISKDEVERARLISEYKYVVDTQSKVVEARREGRLEGKPEIARNLKRRNIPVEQIAEDTGLSRNVIEGL